MAPSTWGPHRITDDDHGPWVTIMAILLMVYMILCYLARLVMRFTINGPFGIDDWVITAGSAVAVVHSSFKLLETREGLGKRGVDVEGSNISNIEKAAYVGDVFYIIALMLSKAATFLLIARLTRYTKHLGWAYMGTIITVLWGIVSVLVLCLRCNLSRPWSQVNPKCPQTYPRWLIIEISGIAVEILLTWLPMYIVWGLRVSLESKLVVLSAFSFRLPVFAVAIIRIFYLRKQNRLDDPIFYGADSSTCMEAEVHYSLIAASIPCLKPFVKAFNTGYLGQQGLHPGTKHAKHAHAGGYQLAAMSGAKDKPVGPDNVMFPAETASGALPVVEQILDTQQQGSDVPSFGASDRISIRRTTVWDVSFRADPSPA